MQRMVVISIVAIIIFCQVHDLLVSVAKLGGMGFKCTWNIMGFHAKGFLRGMELVNGSLRD